MTVDEEGIGGTRRDFLRPRERILPCELGDLNRGKDVDLGADTEASETYNGGSERRKKSGREGERGHGRREGEIAGERGREGGKAREREGWSV